MNEQNAGTEKLSSGSSARSDIGAKSHEAAAQMKSAVAERVDQVKKGADNAREQTAERIRRVGAQLRGMGDTLGSDDRFASTIANRAGQGVDRIATYVSSSDLRRVMHDAENLARRQPALFYGAAFLAGLALGRFVKSSSPEQGEGSEGYTLHPERREREEPLEWEPRGPSQRYRENYEATFGRDIGTGREGSERAVDVHATVSAEEPRLGARSPVERAPESNGGSQQRGRG